MLRVDFTSQELVRLRVAAGVDPLWETALTLHLLQNRTAPLTFGPWRREVSAALRRTGLLPTAHDLMQLCPDAAYFPDFLTPGRGDLDIEESVDRLLATPRRRLLAELTRLRTHTRSPVPPGMRLLADGCPRTLNRLGDSLRAYYRVAVKPYLPVMRAHAASDRARRAEAALAHGVEGMLKGYGDPAGWEYRHGRLRAPYPVDRALRLRGRALTLVPAFFCVRTPLALVNESLPPVLVHPLAPAPGWLEQRRGTPAGSAAQLIGSSRAELLRMLDHPMTTTDLAASLKLAPSTASRHASVLRDAGLLLSHREGVRVLHHRTQLGEALLNGALDRDGMEGGVGCGVSVRRW
ncbi:DNA-binding transcriptional ArsR family regulator [Streptomyces sp. KhCrAH-43]|nr:helix-turn-helix domain-containing protein [Streptomyces sp. SID4920]MYX67205.1 helix-turn-helix domain-containing protein [Streptomyces sp. SID8373]RAJ43768.1 DNA-binding transcriptional ArsR family regulator [Streptomyces sp. KhCrAH-43]